MADPELIEVDLAAFLSDLDPRAMKGLVPAPIGHHAERMLEALRLEAHRLWPVKDGDLVAALLYATDIDDVQDVALKIETYKEARVWQLRQALGEATEQEGVWRVPVRGRGQRRD